MKRKLLVTSVLVLFLFSATAFASANKMGVAKSLDRSGDQMVVDLNVKSDQDLVALDIPLGYSEGAVLEKVEFTDRVGTFEVKVANIDQENHQVVIGLVSMLTKDAPDLAAGEGAIAQLHFRLNPGVEDVEIQPIELSDPNHRLMYVYNDYSTGVPIAKTIEPEIGDVSFSTGGSLPTTYDLGQNTPNPFNPTTTISYALPEAGDVTLTVFNILGQRVVDLVDQFQEAGGHEVVWEGKDASGSSVASGMYFYRIKVKGEANTFEQSKKMMLLK
jgi:hypothetical protein